MTQETWLQKAEKALFFLLLGSSFFNIQKVLIPNVLLLGGPYNEYLDISVYLFDLLFPLFTGLFILNNKNVLKSIVTPLSRFHVEHLTSLVLVFFIAWILARAFESQFIALGLAGSLRFIEGTLLFGYITFYLKHSSLFHVKLLVSGKQSVPRETSSLWNNAIVLFLLLMGAVNSLLALSQFHVKHSIGLTYLGESVLNTSLPGVAKVEIGGMLFLRGYGFFVHPNILAAFLGLLLLFLVEHLLLQRKTNLKRSSTWNRQAILFYVELLVITIILGGFIVAFSKAAIGSLFMVLILRLCYWFHVEHQKKKLLVPRETSRKVSWFHEEHFIGIVSGISALYLSYTTLATISRQSFLEREWGYVLFTQVMPSWNLTGVGIGGYVPRLYGSFAEATPLWILQPVHNFFLLLYAEAGVIGLGIFLFFLSILWNVPRRTGNVFHVEQSEGMSFRRMTFLYTVGICFLDHYFWDIPQGIFLFWVLLAFTTVYNVDK